MVEHSSPVALGPDNRYFCSRFSTMRSFNNIWGFLAVGFVLVFSGKVSKASLFTAYIKTVAEVEVRNTQDLKYNGSQAEIAILTKVRPLTRLITSLSAAWFSTVRFILPEPKLISVRLPLSFEFQHSPSHLFFISAPIRAPGLA